MSEAPYQSLYRRYRPQRFSEMVGQDHVVMALRNAVRDEKVAHAYLFSGPRGTGKTSAARILAKALNCANVTEGEPDGTCSSCISIQNGSSLDVHELDAASNNGVDAMRDLTSRAALGTPGRWKVYIVDEVHMLSTAASNALLKTLEEPPAHVVFVLATTDPQKVLPTIRSRTQHYEFRLLSPELLGRLVHDINNRANLHVPNEAIDLVIRRGKGSARDALSSLDQVAAAGTFDDESAIIDEMTEALCERDTGRALVAVAEGCNSGREPQRLAVDLLEHLRNGFLSIMSKGLVPLADSAVERVEKQARRLGAPALVRAMEAIGEALQLMRDAPETRVTLEVALTRLTKPELSTDPAALLERIERLERAASPRRAEATLVAAARVEAPVRATSERPALGGINRPAPQPRPTSAPQPAPQAQKDSPTAHFPTRDELVEIWGDKILDALPARAKSRFRTGRFISVEGGRATYALPNSIHKERCEEVRNEVEAVLRAHFGIRIPLVLTVDDEAPAIVETPKVEEEEVIDIRETVEAEHVETVSPEERLMKAFPGAQELN